MVMGLDSYAAYPEVRDGKRFLTTSVPSRVVYAKTLLDRSGNPLTLVSRVALGFEQVPSLVGGICSGNGCDGSFRGKCYNSLVEEVTGYSLYEDELPPPVVEIMADRLRKASKANPLPIPPEQALDTLAHSDSPDPRLGTAYDLYGLACFFEACASRGYSVVSWY